MTRSTTPAAQLAALSRHLRICSALSQRALASAAGVSLRTLQTWEGGRAPTPPLQRAAGAAGMWLWALPAPPEDPAADAALEQRLRTTHPVDHVQEVVLRDGRSVAGVAPPEWIRFLDACPGGCLLVGPAAEACWLPTLAGRPLVLEAHLVVPSWWEPPSGFGVVLRLTRTAGRLPSAGELAAAGLPPHVQRASVLLAAQPGGSIRVLHPADLLLTVGWHPEFVRAAVAVNETAERDGQGRRARARALRVERLTGRTSAVALPSGSVGTPVRRAVPAPHPDQPPVIARSPTTAVSSASRSSSCTSSTAVTVT